MAKALTAPWVLKAWVMLKTRPQDRSLCQECGVQQSVGYACVENHMVESSILQANPWHKDVYLCQECADADTHVAVLRLAKLVRVED